jgi:hypothetical protein
VKEGGRFHSCESCTQMHKPPALTTCGSSTSCHFHEIRNVTVKQISTLVRNKRGTMHVYGSHQLLCRSHKAAVQLKARTVLSLVASIDTASVVQWSEFLAANPELPGSIPDATRFSE